MFPKVDTSSLQAEEVWTGVTYAVAAAMIQEVESWCIFQVGEGLVGGVGGISSEWSRIFDRMNV